MNLDNKKNAIINKLLLVLAISLGVFGFSRLYFRLTDDFRLSNIRYEMPYRQQWEIPAMAEDEQKQLDAILQQKFRYIGKGAQAYAFRSEDGKYVLKLFKFKHLKPSLFTNMLPPIGFLKTYKERQSERKNRLLNSVFDGYRLAYDVHAKETGLIYIHLNKSNNLHKIATVIDKIGFHRKIDLDQIPFIVQENVKTTRAEIIALMDEQRLSTVEQRIRQIMDLYVSEYNKGIYDRDHGVTHNTGFAGDRPIHLDVGKLSKDDKMKEKENAKADLQIVMNRFNAWFESQYPVDYPRIKAYVDQQMHEIFDERP